MKFSPHNDINNVAMMGADAKVPVYYHSGGRYFRKCILRKLSNEYKELQIKRKRKAQSLVFCPLLYAFGFVCTL